MAPVLLLLSVAVQVANGVSAMVTSVMFVSIELHLPKKWTGTILCLAVGPKVPKTWGH